VKYIADRYESHIQAIKEELITEIKNICSSREINSEDFERAIANKFSNEVKF
jgi:hypothetical protein